jgi:hypothetical protein
MAATVFQFSPKCAATSAPESLRARSATARARAVALLARKLSWAEVAAHFGLDSKTVATIADLPL